MGDKQAQLLIVLRYLMPFAFRFDCSSGQVNIFHAEAYGDKNKKLMPIFSSLFKTILENRVRAF